MAEYRYLFADFFSAEVIAELPMYGVSLSHTLSSGSGNATASFNLSSTGFDSADTIAATEPLNCMYVERDGSLIWGGVIWTRTYQAQSDSIQLNLQPLESYFWAVTQKHRLKFEDVDQRNIILGLINDMQNNAKSDMGLTVPSDYVIGSDSVVRNFIYEQYDGWSYGKCIDHLLEFDGAPDYTIDLSYDADGNIVRTLVVDNEIGQATSNLYFYYPGNIKNFWWPESASKGVNDLTGFGDGEGYGRLRRTLTLDDGLPQVSDVITRDGVTVAATLDEALQQEMNNRQLPYTSPTFELYTNVEPSFGDWKLGDWATLVLECSRFPDKKIVSVRIVGWQLSPDNEVLSLTLEGEDGEI